MLLPYMIIQNLLIMKQNIRLFIFLIETTINSFKFLLNFFNGDDNRQDLIMKTTTSLPSSIRFLSHKDNNENGQKA